ncbi:MAG TPA: hypothetical protein P5081_14830 [Phycisphaerae bacterium]|nr:hypothetical protein [Phycisphaerae bacterium]
MAMIAVAGAVGLLGAIAESRASTVTPMSVATMSDYAAQVIIADIGDTTSAWADQPRRIETTVELRNIEYLKGGYDGAPTRRTLITPGGAVGEFRQRICCAPEFRTGQRWVLFLLPDYRTFPTVGLGQGAFRVVDDSDGVAHVYQHGGLPVAGVNDETWIEYAVSPRAHVHGQVSSASSTLRVVDHSKEATRPLMSFDAFRAAIQPTLDASRDHKLSRPAGNRIVVTLRPVPIRGANAKAAAPTAGEKPRTSQSIREATPERRRGASTHETPPSESATGASDNSESRSPVANDAKGGE